MSDSDESGSNYEPGTGESSTESDESSYNESEDEVC
jgi:hypothetical protein